MQADHSGIPPELDDDGDDGDEPTIALSIGLSLADGVHRGFTVLLDLDADPDTIAEALVRSVQAVAIHAGGELPAAVLRRLAG